jgi:hypothetical protein
MIIKVLLFFFSTVPATHFGFCGILGVSLGCLVVVFRYCMYVLFI